MADYRVNLKEREKKEKYMDLARELKKQWNMKVTVIPIVIGAPDIITQGLVQGNKRTCRNHPNSGIAAIGQNTEKRPGNLLSLKFQGETTT